MRTRLFCIVVCFTLAVLMTGAAEPVEQRHPDYDEVKRVIEYSIGWAVEKDFDKMFAVWAQDEHLYHHWLSSKSTTRGFTEFAEHAKTWEDPKFKGTTYEFRGLEITLSQAGDVAWYSCRLDDCYEYDGKPGCVENVLQTGVLEKRDGNWVHVLMHGSFPVDEIPKEYINRYYGDDPAAAPAAEPGSEPLFRVRRLTDHILIFTQISPWESNHVVIESDKGLVLVDPGPTPLFGRLIREAVARELGRDRFTYVINTHGHWGHTWGNAAFPEATIVGHRQAVETMRLDSANVEGRGNFFRGLLQQATDRLEELDPDGEEAADARLEVEHWERVVKGFEESDFEVQPPGLTFSDSLLLDLGNLTLDMRFFGAGHSNSDIAILIPEEKTVLIGCFFLERGPLPFFGTRPVLEPDRWLEVFGEILDSDVEFEHVVLGQYSVWSRDKLAAVRDYIASLWSDIETLDAEGVTFEQAMARLPIPSELDFIRQAGASDEDLARYHRTEVTSLWRQFKESAAAEVERAINEKSVEAGVALFGKLAAPDNSDVYFDEAEFNILGYRFLQQNKVDEAIAVFQMNVERYPESWNVYDSLGEAYATKGETERAIELYRRSVEINPDNTNGVEAIRRLENPQE